ncbi:SDR family NAD(P)-dependent oxidoreductase [Micromonospora sp. KC606]|uniref:SDR family oxidoreductase n=1 Tax=Micromonospora sp. KC606 TaxID=2530379 RepID=UPI001050BC93|nr:SDR family oxidoreductase [Micromonospora sp. KC606]TDC85414.1 SDR family NAD(P)-dependent oxidoreductase [Micromonospora sp. KC606]
MPRSLSEQVVVVTGASSGVGRETALLLAEQHATVVLAARNAPALHTLHDEVTRLGGTALVCPTDVAEWEQVRRLATTAVGRFGRIDTWVNCAATSLYGRVHQLAPEEITRAIQVTLLGQVYGMRAALDQMRAQGEGGIVNVASALSVQAVPLQAAYVAAKHGVLGFAESLRLELRHDGSPITVSTLLPSSINTPLFQHARSRLGVLPQPIPPVYQPRVVAEAVLHAIAHPQPRVVVGGGAKLLELVHRAAPRLAGTILLTAGRIVDKQHSDRPDDGADNLFTASVGPGSTDGAFGQRAKSTSLYTTLLEHHPHRLRALAAGAALLAVAALRRRGR